MSLKYLLNTNVVSEPIRLKSRHSVLLKLKEHGDEIAIPSIVWHELQFGMERLPASRRRVSLERYFEVVLATMPILDYDQTAAEWHARERARLVALGVTPPFADGQIAAVAHVNNLTLVTFNERDFKQFENLRVLTWK